MVRAYWDLQTSRGTSGRRPFSITCTHQDPQLFLEEDDVSLADDISFLWKQEQLGIAPKEPHDDDKKAWDMFINSVHRDPDTGQFTVRLPYVARSL